VGGGGFGANQHWQAARSHEAWHHKKRCVLRRHSAAATPPRPAAPHLKRADAAPQATPSSRLGPQSAWPPPRNGGCTSTTSPTRLSREPRAPRPPRCSPSMSHAMTAVMACRGGGGRRRAGAAVSWWARFVSVGDSKGEARQRGGQTRQRRGRSCPEGGRPLSTPQSSASAALPG
jgi:hypothetical protein